MIAADAPRHRRHEDRFVFLLIVLSLWLFCCAALGAIAFRNGASASAGASHERSLTLAAFGLQTVRQTHSFDSSAPLTLSVGRNAVRRYSHADAQWIIPTYTFDHLYLSNPRRSLRVIVVGDDPVAFERNAYATISVNGRRIARLTVATHRHDRYYEMTTARSLIRFSSLDGEMAQVIPLNAGIVASSPYARITVATFGGASWEIKRIGISLTYEPVAGQRTEGLATFFAIPCATAIVLALAFFFRRISAWLGLFGLALATFVALLGFTTQDGWDFPTWEILANVASYGGGNPALFWAGTPLWAFVPAIVSPISHFLIDASRLSNVLTDALLLKSLFVLAGLGSIVIVCELSKKRHVALLFATSPLFLYVLAWGARDVVSGAFVLLAFLSIRKTIARWPIAAAAIVIATSIDEYYAPLLLLGPLLYFVGARALQRRWIVAPAIFVGELGIFGSQWLVLPPAYARSILGYRVASSTVFGSASVPQLLSYSGLAHSTILGIAHLIAVATYAALTASILWFLRKTLRGDVSDDALVREGISLILAVTSAFYLWYQIVNPQEWYGLFVLLFAMGGYVRTSPRIGAVFGLIGGTEIYAHLGIGEFLSPYFFTPYDYSIVGLRSTADIFLIGFAVATIVSVCWSAARRRLESTVGTLTPVTLAILFASFLSRFYRVDGAHVLEGLFVVATIFATFMLVAISTPFCDRTIERLRHDALSIPLRTLTVNLVVVGVLAVTFGPNPAIFAAAFFALANRRGDFRRLDYLIVVALAIVTVGDGDLFFDQGHIIAVAIVVTVEIAKRVLSRLRPHETLGIRL